jgi:hypothetical protein
MFGSPERLPAFGARTFPTVPTHNIRGSGLEVLWYLEQHNIFQPFGRQNDTSVEKHFVPSGLLK